tara:strand:- start:690 stop:890 length:201 start_codon:yes stop_codon:yes gene_type:complete
MTKYTKEFWKDYESKRSKASKGTIDFIDKMFNNRTLKIRRITWDNYYMVTGLVRHNRDEMRNLTHY